jgi:C-terminal processing protease CtpA/Prc
MQLLSKSEKAAIAAKVKKTVLNYHINAGGIDYDAWAKRFDASVDELPAADTATFEAGIRSLLSELKTSHTGFYHDVPDQLLPQHTINATLRKVSARGTEHWMFLDVFEDGPAAKAGIQAGQLLFAIDEVPVEANEIPKFAIDRTYRLTIGWNDERATRTAKVNVPHAKGSKERPPLVPPKTLTFKMLEPGLGYLRIGWFPGPLGVKFSQELDSAIRALREQGCDRLIIDLRGNIGGGLGFARLASYLTPDKIAIGQSLTPKRLRSGYQRADLPRVPMPSTLKGVLLALARFLVKDKSLVLLTQGLGPQPFHGRVAILVNEWTNSAAEMVANFAQENHLATLVGTKTPGTVLGARNFDVGSGYWLRIPIFGWFTSRGGTIEGTGVIPDVSIDSEQDLLNQGADRPLAAAAELSEVNKPKS